jgi:hypothetical protein
MLRGGMAVIAFALPVVLLVGGHWASSGAQPTSISGYYHTAMRNVFVGALITLGVFLLLYRAFNRLENWLLNIAGLAVICVALLPCGPDQGATDTAARTFTAAQAHGICAMVAFGCLAAVAIFLGRDTVSLLPDQPTRRRYTRVYVALGIAMIVLPAAALLLAHWSVSWLFWVESAALWVFATYWTVKTEECHRVEADLTAMTGGWPMTDRDTADAAVRAHRAPDYRV